VLPSENDNIYIRIYYADYKQKESNNNNVLQRDPRRGSIANPLKNQGNLSDFPGVTSRGREFGSVNKPNSEVVSTPYSFFRKKRADGR